MKINIAAPVFLVTAIFLILFNVESAFGQTGPYLPKNQDQLIDIQPYDVYGNELPKPKLRGADQFQMKWRHEDAKYNLLTNRQGILYYADSENVIHAVFENGVEKWQLKVDQADWPVDLSLGKDGTLYAYTTGDSSEGEIGWIGAINPEGKIIWNKRIRDLTTFLDIFSGDANGNVITITERGLISIDRTGEINWIQSELGKFTGEKDTPYYWMNNNLRAIDTDDAGRIFVITEENQLFILGPDGIILWRVAIPSYKDEMYVSGEGIVYFLSENGLYAVNSTDGTLTEHPNIDQQTLDSLGIPNDGNGGMYLNYDTNGLMNIEANGNVKWRYRTGDGQYYWLDEISSDEKGNVYFANTAGNIYSLDKHGHERFIFIRNNKMWTNSSMVIGRSGNVYCVMDEIGLIAIGKKEVQLYIDNQFVQFSQPPVIVNGTTLVQFRPIFETLGLQIGWDSATRTVTGTKEDFHISLQIDNEMAEVNDKQMKLSVAPRIINGSTFVPLRFVAEALGGEVKWNGELQTIGISTK